MSSDYSDNYRTVFERRLLRETDHIRRPFLPYGLLPALGLGIVFLWALFPFASHIENEAETNARAALIANGMTWATPRADGQRIILDGVAPSRGDANRAINVVKEERRKTWLGRFKPVWNVDDRQQIAAAGTVPAAPLPSNNGTLSTTDVDPAPLPLTYTFRLVDGVLTLSGDIPDPASRTAIVAAAEALIAPPRFSRINDQLRVTGQSARPGYLDVALRGVNTVGRCDRGTSQFDSASFSVECDLSASAFDLVNQTARAPIGLGRIGDVSLITNEAVRSCEQSLSGLLSVAKIEFATGSADIDPASSSLLNSIASAAVDCPGTLRIEGHTDATGSLGFNNDLSLRRAESVRLALVQRGLPPGRLVARGFGPNQPIASNATDTGRARNRRIEFRVERGVQ